MGSRQARVRLTIKAQQAPATQPEKPAKPASAPAAEISQTVDDEIEPVHVDRPQPKPAQEPVKAVAEAQDDFDLTVAEDVVRELLVRMNIQAYVDAHYGEPDDAQSRIPLRVDINGKDLSILIGPSAETLNALQYIASLIIGKELGKSVPLVVDVEGYRERRLQQFANWRNRMADQAVKQAGARRSSQCQPVSGVWCISNCATMPK